MTSVTNHGPNLFLPREAEILRADRMTDSETHFTLRMRDGSSMVFGPGQMMEVSVPGYGEIPIGYASSPTRTHSFDIVVRRVGRVSTAITSKGRADSLWIRGPLGHGFDLDRLRGHPVLVVAGGIGLCPTRSLIQYILDRREEFGKFTLFFGARSPGELLFLDDLARWRRSDQVEYHETVDRPDPDWKGNVGVITTLFASTRIEPETRVVLCGPPVMYPHVVRELQAAGIPDDHVLVDLERRMKCGVGKCGHCQINDRYVCFDGPVFRYDEVRDLEEAFE